MAEIEAFPCGQCNHPVITYWSTEGLEDGDYILMGEVFFHKGKCANTYIEEFNEACNTHVIKLSDDA